MNSVPSSKLKRSKIVAKGAIKAGSKLTSSAIKRAFMSSNKKANIKSQTDKEVAKIVAETLGALKGVSVKIAQQIALAMPFLPKEYLEQLNKSFSQIPPINKALVRKIIKQELQAYPEEIFEYFNSIAFAAASLGQVHLGVIDGKKVAIKVQYPGIKKSIQSDISILKFIFKRFANGGDVEHLIGEIKDRLDEELNYTLEAKHSEIFKSLNNKDIIIPKVYKNFSTSRVLTTQYIEGKSFLEYLKTNPSQKQKNHYAQIIFDYFFESFYKLNIVHADPNPGNFIFTDKKLALIDFGCVKRVEKSFVKDFSILHKMLLEGADDKEITKEYYKQKMAPNATLDKQLDFYQSIIKPLDRFYIEVLVNDSYDFAKNSNFTKRGFELIKKVQSTNKTSASYMSKDYIFIDRTLLGYYAMFEQMGAKIDTTYAKKLIFQGAKWE
jgi:predicted unusual protein kinase regulating ubiquinone biosynthesis (AarF/ABC1/UbiB family)